MANNQLSEFHVQKILVESAEIVNNGRMETTEDSKGKCISCGFLCKCSTEAYHHPNFYDLSQPERKGLHVLIVYEKYGSGTPNPVQIHLRCFRGETEFNHSYNPRSGGRSIDQPFPLVSEDEIAVNLDRGCKKWMAYTPNIGPHREWEELRMSELQLQNERLHKEIETRTREHTDEMAAANEKFNQVMLKLTRGMFWLTIVGVALTLVSVLGLFAPQIQNLMHWANTPPQPTISQPTTR